ncbi:hypothetical protein FH972_023845 [Carpinus fangiana]|uniref:EF-hand domain-containing protein n=1 Tax=Carpinus fangiana TaxID=176857 RepID=A0A5N6KWQ1_9ROSI|nr:hypothetical protein FH972_023845 [Carpinus fangiana]
MATPPQRLFAIGLERLCPCRRFRGRLFTLSACLPHISTRTHHGKASTQPASPTALTLCVQMSHTQNTSPKKPSPLSYQSPSQRTSPFKREQQSPMALSPATVRASSPAANSASWSTRSNTGGASKSGASPVSSRGHTANRGAHDSGDVLSRLPPAQLREMRESFQTLDRNNDGIVGRDDIAEMLTQFGQDPSSSSTFPTQTNLATYLSQIATSLLPLSRPDELTVAFAAFDVDDSGQVDVEELRRALLQTGPEPGERKLDAGEIDRVLGDFTGRRAFKRGLAVGGPAARGDVFRYGDFVSSVGGKGEEDKEAQP